MFYKWFRTGADQGFFLGGGVPLRNDVTDGEVKKLKSEYLYTKKKASSQGGGGGAHPLHPTPRSALVATPVFALKEIFKIIHHSRSFA